MGSWIRRATGLLTAASVAGVPALLVACVALCVPGVADASAHAGHTEVAAVADSSPSGGGHGSHHAGAHAPRAHDGHQREVSADTALHAGASCCPAGPLVIGNVVPAARADRGGLDAAVSFVHVPSASHVRLSSSTFHHRTTIPPPPLRSLLVLRI